MSAGPPSAPFPSRPRLRPVPSFLPSSRSLSAAFQNVFAEAAFVLYSRWVLSFGVVTAVPCSERSEFADSSLPADTGFGLRTDYAGEGSLGWEDDTVGGVPMEETAWGVEEKATRPPTCK